MNAAALQEAAVVGLYHAFRVTLPDSRSVGVYGIQQHLHIRLPSALQVARIVVGDHQSRIKITPRNRLAQLINGGVISGQPEALALCHDGPQFAAFRSAAVINHPKPQVRHRGVQREAKQQQLQRGRHNQRHGKTTVAPDLIELFANQRS